MNCPKEFEPDILNTFCTFSADATQKFTFNLVKLCTSSIDIASAATEL